MKSRQKTKAKMTATNPGTVKTLFRSLGDFAEEKAWNNVEGCGVGERAMPAAAIFCSDEIQMCLDEGHQMKVVAGGKTVVTVPTTGLHNFTLTMVVTISLEGILMPSFGIFDGVEWGTVGGRTRQIPDSFARFVTNKSGGMVGSKGAGFSVEEGTMVASHWVETGRQHCGDVVTKDEWLLRIVDNHASHLDDIAI